jgi:hypothetical protein
MLRARNEISYAELGSTGPWMEAVVPIAVEPVAAQIDLGDFAI